MSIYVKPNDAFPRLNLEPHITDHLNPWPATTTVLSSPSQQSNEDQMSGIEIAARTIMAAAQGLEDAKIKKLSSACNKSALVLAFTFAKEGPAKSCRCLSRKIVLAERSDVVSAISADLDAGRSFDDAIEILPEVKLTNYLESCITSPNAKSPTSQREIPKMARPKPKLTLEQQAVVRFPDPVKPTYKGEQKYNNPLPTRRIQGYMKRWEQLTGKVFLTEHWSMKPRAGHNKNGVLTKATTGNGVWPNILDAYSAAKQTILNSYKTEWYRVATAEEMRQCIRPAEPKLPRVCSDPKKNFLIAECFSTSSWQEPGWCSQGYERNFHISSNAKLEQGGLAEYGNAVGDCLVRADAGGSPLIQTKDNGKKIRGCFFKNNLLKNAFVSVECGQEWRDFAKAVYNAKTDHEFIAADPLSLTISNMNKETLHNIDAYNRKLKKVITQRKKWIADQRIKN